MKKREEMNLLVSVNQKYLKELKEMLFSFGYYNKEYLNIYLMNIELNEEQIEDLSKFIQKKCHGRLIPIKFDSSSIINMPVTDGEGNYFGLEAYSRLFSPYLLPQELDRLLYLDADIICGDSIKELYDMDFDGNYVLACQDKVVSAEEKTRLGLPANYLYINSGMLLINLPEIRKNFTQKEIVQLIIEQSSILKYPDQDFINKNFAGKIKIVSDKFNLLVKDVKKENLTFKPAIYHYAGSVKAWDDNVNRFDIAFIKPYYRCLFLEGKYYKLWKIYREHSKNRKKRNIR